jgi:heat shock protein HslJ
MKYPIAILSFLFLFSCTNNNPQESRADTTKPVAVNDTALLKGKWMLTAMKGDTSLATFFSNGYPHISVSPITQMIGGFSGCNHFGGEAVVTIDSMRLTGTVQSTAIGCYGSGEDLFLRHLYSSRGYRVSEDSLVLVDSTATTVLSFWKSPSK